MVLIHILAHTNHNLVPSFINPIPRCKPRPQPVTPLISHHSHTQDWEGKKPHLLGDYGCVKMFISVTLLLEYNLKGERPSISTIDIIVKALCAITRRHLPTPMP
ncbi:hypothetical protein DID88_008059 [Monilinia fructigena]|uniref:Uncharacterized protein n=1 Tax=Monilinia fructigena TaxID=38457 RepID=A0A395J4T8_9HELO|nr:hypothetical protein DID88_008059 [Monilinia fructigena]